MAMLCGVVGALSSFYHEDLDITDAAQRKTVPLKLIAKLPTIAAMAYKYNVGQPFVYPRNDLSYAENFLHMMFSVPAEEYKLILLLLKQWIKSSCFTQTTSKTLQRQLYV